MKTKLITCLMALLLLWTSNLVVLAEARNIYIGDIITMQVSSKDLTIEELREKFNSFDIVDIKSAKDGYLISIRTFEIGEHKIFFGDKDIVINVQSVLDDIEREDIFDGDITVAMPSFLFHWRILFCIVFGVFFLSGSLFLIKTFIKKKVKIPTPLQTFLLETASVLPEHKDYFVIITQSFKEYLQRLYKFQIIGKTSAEIIDELKKGLKQTSMLTEIQEWLMECDRLKFTGVTASSKIKQQHYEELVKIVKKIDIQNEELAC